MAAQNIAWIGAGKMGLPICKRLKAAGHAVRILARSKARATELAEDGFEPADSVASLVAGADLVFTSVSDDKALADAVIGGNMASALPGSAVLIDMSTVSPAVSAEIASYLPQTIAYLRSPVSGSTIMAEAGTLTALVSGPKAAFESLQEIFACFARKAFHLGEAEEARVLKLAVNSMVAATAALLGEALAFGRKGGLTHEAMLEVITQSAVASPLIGYKKDMIISGDYSPAATLNMLLKDLDLLLSAARAQATPMPVSEMVQRIYAAAAREGLGEQDFFVLVQQAERAAGARPA